MGIFVRIINPKNWGIEALTKKLFFIFIFSQFEISENFQVRRNLLKSQVNFRALGKNLGEEVISKNFQVAAQSTQVCFPTYLCHFKRHEFKGSQLFI